MPLFTYKAIREDGTSIKDEAIAADAKELRLELESKGYLVLNIDKKRAGLREGSGSAKDFLLFNQEFTTLIKAGLPILQSLELLQKRTEKAGFRNVLDNIIHDIKGGSTLSDAMAKHPAFFSPLYTATVRAGEKSGALVDVLRRFIEYQKKMLSIQRKLVTALAYPAFLVLALCAVLLLFFLYIIPNFTQMYGEQGGQLPMLTTLLISFTNILKRFFPFFIIVAITTGVGVWYWQKN